MCIDCSSNLKKILKCDKCNIDFEIKHRNVSKRKFFLCKECDKKRHLEMLKEQNDSLRRLGLLKPFLVSKKGYSYLRNADTNFQHKLLHREIVAKYIGRDLTKEDVVHHIDGNKANNTIDNLFLTDDAGHHLAHISLQKLSYYLIQKNIIKFDKDTGTYFLNYSEVGELIDPLDC